MASYNPSTFGPYTPDYIVTAFEQKFGVTGTDYYTVSYSGLSHQGYSDYYIYTICFFNSRDITMGGTVFSNDISNPNCVKTHTTISVMYMSMGFHTQTEQILVWSGSASFNNRYLTLFSIGNNASSWGTLNTWADVNMYSTVNITNTDDGTYNYNAMNNTDEFICTKDPDYYIIHLGVRATANSDYTDFAYCTKYYTVRLKWTSPVTGTNFDILLNGMPSHIQHLTVDGDYFNLIYTTETDVYLRGLCMPLGRYFILVPSDFAECTDVPALYDISLTDLKSLAQTQQGGVINDDLFTEITAEFYYNTELKESKTVDFSSLFGEDIDIGGATVVDPNAGESLTDDNVYTDSIELTTPTLTATGVFNRCYVLDGNSVNDLCDFLYNSNDSIFDEIIDGVLTRGNPIESLIDLRLYPFDVRAFTGAGTAESIKFGRTDTGVIGIKLPHTSQAVIDLGSCTIPRYYNNFLDYAMSAQLYIPFCGVVDLPIDRILNHKLSIKLIVDYITGAGTAVVFVDNIPLLYQQGVIGISIPMTATNSAEFGKTIVGNLINTATAGNIPAALSSGLNTAIDLYNGSSIQKIGASSPQTSLFQPKNAYVLLSIVSPAAGVYDNEYAQTIGYECFMPASSISIMTGSGFTVFDNVQLNIPQATAEEREKILELLRSGVFM